MIIIPAIDLKGGRCVRLTQGRMDAEIEYSTNPAEVAQRWEAAGASLIHLVDLDGAIEGNARNLDVIREIVKAVKTPVQIGGGIRDMRTAELYLDAVGVRRVIIGTAALTSPGFIEALGAKYPGRIAVGIDAKDGLVAIKGWVEVTKERASALAKRLEGAGAACIIYTDIARDGMLNGPNVAATKELAESINIPVIASGGISSLEDIESYAGVPLEGIIVGKALYAGNFELKDAINTAKRLS